MIRTSSTWHDYASTHIARPIAPEFRRDGTRCSRSFTGGRRSRAGSFYGVTLMTPDSPWTVH
jgi:hypothetical protein